MLQDAETLAKKEKNNFENNRIIIDVHITRILFDCLSDPHY